jgi:hypothetical protein
MAADQGRWGGCALVRFEYFWSIASDPGVVNGEPLTPFPRNRYMHAHSSCIGGLITQAHAQVVYPLARVRSASAATSYQPG